MTCCLAFTSFMSSMTCSNLVSYSNDAEKAADMLHLQLSSRGSMMDPRAKQSGLWRRRANIAASSKPPYISHLIASSVIRASFRPWP